MITININEKPRRVASNTGLMDLKAQVKPEADLVVYNGFPVTENIQLEEGDSVVLIKRGEVPSEEELEVLMMARHTPGVHEKVRKGRVGIAGLGGLGSQIAFALARVGVGTLVLVDYDVVEPSNLNRQQYFIDQIGMLKVDALRENLQRVNPYVNLSTHNVILDPEKIGPIFADVEIVVEAFDRADMKAMLMNTISELYPDKYVIAASGLAGYEESNTITTTRFSSRIYIVGDQRAAARPGMGLMAPRVGIAAHHQANLVLRILLGAEGEGTPT
jgi:sulfur carrier protein ThiS adenylyltransferase